MRGKLFFSTFAVSMVVFLLCFVLTLSVLYTYFSERYVDELRNEAIYLSSAYSISGDDFLLTLSDDVSNRITVISESGTVIFDTYSEENSINYSETEEFVKAKSDGIGEAVRYSATQKAEIAYCAVLLENGIILRVSGVKYTVVTLIIDLISPVIIIIFLAIFMSLILAAKVSAAITKPINDIDLNYQDSRDVYSELQPLVEKIHEQNVEIDRQTQELRAEHELQDSYRREFTANVSHELKTPLTAISGAAELMSAGLVKSEDVPRFAENIYSEAQRLIVLVNDIMELSKLDENAVPDRTVVDLYDASDKTLKRLSKAAEKANVSLRLDGKSTLLVGVENIIHEIVYNLCDNAIKYNKSGGHVAVVVGDNADNVFVRVSDTGIGIPEADLGRVFERFYRVDKSHSSSVGGTGLGLSIVKNGAALHGGKVDIESRLGEGTVITVNFPKQNVK